MQISRVGDASCIMGEGPIWDEALQELFFTDVFGNRILRYSNSRGAFDEWSLPSTVSSVALLRDGTRLIVATGQGLHFMDLKTGALTPINDPTADRPTEQLNDGRVDAAGRYVVGSVDIRGGNSGRLYSVEADGTVRQLDEGFAITNGPCWSPDGKTLYLANSTLRQILAYDYDIASGDVSNRRVFADTSAFAGIPDGASVDTEGRLWTAMCDGAKVVCFAPDGQVERSIDMPTGFVSAVAFGGPDMDRLFVTSMDASRLTELLAAQGAQHGPDDIGGALFVIDGLGAKGLTPHRFGRTG